MTLHIFMIQPRSEYKLASTLGIQSYGLIDMKEISF